MKKTLLLIGSTLLCLVSLPGIAGNWGLGGYLGYYSLNNEKAKQEGIDDTALALGFIADYHSDSLLTTTFGAEILFYDDNNSFSQQVEVVGGFDDGDIRTESSDANAFTVYFETGPRWNLGSNEEAYISLKGGVETVFLSERSISLCSDCREEDIDIDGGLYLTAAIVRNLNHVSIGFHYQQFLDDDDGLESGLRFVVGATF